MKTVGLITEYNPFHLGHRYHIEKAKEVSGADTVIVLMSGNYVQRGTPALFDKYIRSETALLNGADLILELPTIFSTASAEYFAKGAIYLLTKSGITDTICFGSESGVVSDLQELADLLLEEPEEYRICLRQYLKEGLPFPLAREYAVRDYSLSSHKKIDSSLLSTPNNLLGIEYLKALSYFQSDISPYTIQRIHAGYHDTDEAHRFYSAGALRQSRLDAPNDFQKTLREISPVYENAIPICLNDFSDILGEKLLSEALHGDFTAYADISVAFANTLKKHAFQYTGAEEFIRLLKTKNYTHTRISRCLLHLLLGVTKEMLLPALSKEHGISYIRVLGYSQKGRTLLGSLSRSLTLVTKPAGDASSLSGLNQSVYHLNLYADMLYRMIQMKQNDAPIPTEYERKLLSIR